MTDLDRQVAVEVMKQQPCCCAKPHIGWDAHLCLKCGGVVGMEYSTDIAAAWKVVEKMKSLDSPRETLLFLDALERFTETVWPGVFLYITPETICKSALFAIKA